MSLQESFQSVGRVLETRLFDIGETPITVSTLLTLLIILAFTFLIASILRRALQRLLAARGVKPGTAGLFSGVLYYGGLITGAAVALQTAGINLTALFAAGAIFAVGIGFGLQSIAENFISGVILLTERAIKPGDVLEVQGLVVRVLEMGIRSTIARTRDGEDLIIPNSTLIQSTVKNHTLKDSLFRIRVPVGVIYASDMARVRQVLEQVADQVSAKWAVAGQKPHVFMTAFGDSSVNFEVAIWMSNPWEARPALSDLHESIWWAFKENGITIAFPQLDVHFDAPVTEGFRRLSGRAA